MTCFYSRLSYSFGNEDWETENHALQVRPGDRVFCITGSGDRPLHCLLTSGAEVVAVDANPIQNYLLALKAAALSKLDFGEYLGFLGAEPCEERERYFQACAPLMDEEIVRYWQSQSQMVEKGILYQGHVERLLGGAARVIGFLRGGKVRRLFESNDLEEQRKLVDSEWSNWSWRKAFDLVMHPSLTRKVVGDPGVYEQVAPTVHVGRYLHDRIDGYLRRGLAGESLLLSLILLGKVNPEGFTPYLREEGVDQIRPNLENLSFETNNAIDYLQQSPEGSFDRFSLSDIASYMPEENFHALIEAVCHAAKPGARFCFRQFLSDHEFPKALSDKVEREPELEAQLEQADRCFVYRYIVGRVIG